MDPNARPAALDPTPLRKRLRPDDFTEKNEWRRFKILKEENFASPVVSLDVVQTARNAFSFLVASSANVDYSTIKQDGFKVAVNEPVIKNSKLKGTLTKVQLRSDGALGAACNEEGVVQVFDPRSKTRLRSLKGHKAAVNAAAFFGHSTVLSGGDDCSLILWDITDGSQICSVADAHSSTIKCIVPQPSCRNSLNTSDVVATGSNDGYVKLWRIEFTPEQKPVLKATDKFHHGHPVESIAWFPSRMLLITAGGREVKVWSTTGGGRLLSASQTHLKTITDVAVSGNGQYFTTSSLDQTVKFFSTDGFKVFFSLKYESPVMAVKCLTTIAGDDLLLVGLLSGEWDIRRRHSPILEAKARAEQLDYEFSPHLGTARFLQRGPEARPSKGAIVVDPTALRQKMLPALNKLIATFRTADALDKALRSGRAVALAYIEYLVESSLVAQSVRGRSEQSLTPILRFSLNELGRDTASTPLLIEFLTTVFDENRWLRTSDDADLLRLVHCIACRLSDELGQLRLAGELSGIIEMIDDSRRAQEVPV